MKYLLTILLAINPINYISEINATQRQAQEAFQQNRFAQAILKYRYLTDELKVDNPQVFLNLAHAYFERKSYKSATIYYDKILQMGNKASQSIALNQLALIQYEKENYQDALELFKQAVKKDPQNYRARYNYELTLKKIKSHPKHHQHPSSQSQSNTPSSNNNPESLSNQANEEGTSEQEIKENQAQSEGNEQNEKPIDESNETSPNNPQAQLKPQKLEEIKLNRERAEAILETMKNQEIQYIQQMRRRRKNTSRKNKNEKNW